MRIILLGCPGAGKGTQSNHLAKKFNIPIISTGEMLRTTINSGSFLGKKIKSMIEHGSLVPDNIITNIVKNRLNESDCKRGYLLDGFPRTIVQADELQKSSFIIEYVIEISVSDEEIIKRLSGRRIHQKSGRIYHLQYNPPKKHGFDDHTGDKLIQREDDCEEVVKHRLKIYHEKTEPLVKYYQVSNFEGYTPKYIKINGLGEISEVQQRILDALNIK